MNWRSSPSSTAAELPLQRLEPAEEDDEVVRVGAYRLRREASLRNAGEERVRLRDPRALAEDHVEAVVRLGRVAGSDCVRAHAGAAEALKPRRWKIGA